MQYRGAVAADHMVATDERASGRAERVPAPEDNPGWSFAVGRGDRRDQATTDRRP
jgi:hypothetical protein